LTDLAAKPGINEATKSNSRALKSKQHLRSTSDFSWNLSANRQEIARTQTRANLVMLFVLELVSICIKLSSTGSALTAFVASNNFLIESRKNLPTTSLSDMEAISLIAGYRFNQEGENMQVTYFEVT